MFSNFTYLDPFHPLDNLVPQGLCFFSGRKLVEGGEIFGL